ncbi:MAG TPA: hypothetical protein PKW55_07455 [Spirochaetota bacterium]|nr:hypothetical protein [Spirochaetota bacterium]HOM38583.1 hypothetical protein [Spirochaetota bacterium]HPQ49720.1 hypothetical protein [Spirochaetota bacterium]
MVKKEKRLIISFIIISFFVVMFLSFIFYLLSSNAGFIIDILGIGAILYLIVRNFIIRFNNSNGSILKRIVYSIPKITIFINIFFIIFFVIPAIINKNNINITFLIFIIISFIILILTILKLIFRNNGND